MPVIIIILVMGIFTVVFNNAKTEANKHYAEKSKQYAYAKDVFPDFRHKVDKARAKFRRSQDICVRTGDCSQKSIDALRLYNLNNEKVRVSN